MATAEIPNPPVMKGGIGVGVKRVDGTLKVTGAARYASDMGVMNPAYAYFHTSPIALGRIVDIDEREARALPGVLDILTWRTPGLTLEKIAIFSAGGIASTSIMPLQSANVRHDGETVAVILAESYEAARDASHRLRIRYDERKPTATFGEPGLVAEKPGAGDPRAQPIRIGDASGAFAASPVKLDRRYATPTQHHNPLELFTTTAEWQVDQLTVYEGSQNMVGLQHGIAAQLDHDPAKTRLVSLFVGGAFGCRGSLTPRTALVAIAARRLGRPVKFVSTRDHAFTLATHRAETRQRVRLGATRAGKLTALLHEGDEISSRADAYVVAGTDVTSRMYACPAIGAGATIQHADRDTPGFMRGPAEVPYMFALESAIDELAETLRMDPVELRRINEPAHDPVSGALWSSRSLVQCYDAASEAFGWSRRNPAPKSMVDGDWQVGWGCATAAYPTYLAPAFARVTLSPAGAKVEVAGHEIGTGAYTIYAQVAADRLGLRVEQVEVRLGDSRLPPAPVAGGSNNAASISSAIAASCAVIHDRLAHAAVDDRTGRLAGRDPKGLLLTDGLLQAADGTGETLAEALPRLGGAVEELGAYEPDGVKPGALAGLRAGKIAFAGATFGKDFTRMAFGAEFVEVRVHRRTREIRVPRIVGAFAGGRILNPRTARSQLMGGMIWGIGSALHEATEIDRRYARYTNDNFAEYLVPVNADVPSVEVLFVPEEDPHVNPLGVKGLGELGIVGTNAAVANAVYHATGKRIRELPIRIEDLLDA